MLSSRRVVAIHGTSNSVYRTVKNCQCCIYTDYIVHFIAISDSRRSHNRRILQIRVKVYNMVATCGYHVVNFYPYLQDATTCCYNSGQSNYQIGPNRSKSDQIGDTQY